MTQVISIIKHCGPNDLVLLDELGSGTDPEEGSALAAVSYTHLRMANPLKAKHLYLSKLMTFVRVLQLV